MRRITAALLLAVALASSLTPTAFAATPEETAAGLSDGLYVEPGADALDVDRVVASIDRAAANGLELRVVVLADPAVDAVAFAAQVNDLLTGTVLVFSPAAYGASSAALSRGEMNSALAAADDQLSGPSIADGVDAFVDAALTETSSTNWGLILAGIAAVLLIVGLGGRQIEQRAAASRRERALGSHWSQLKTRADALSGPIIELSTKVQLDGRPQLAAAFRDASNRYGTLQDQLARPPTDQSAAEIEVDLGGLEAQIGALEEQLA
jgi:hypothetical protein